jgi:hypothetical protein
MADSTQRQASAMTSPCTLWISYRTPVSKRGTRCGAQITRTREQARSTPQTANTLANEGKLRDKLFCADTKTVLADSRAITNKLVGRLILLARFILERTVFRNCYACYTFCGVSSNMLLRLFSFNGKCAWAKEET